MDLYNASQGNEDEEEGIVLTLEEYEEAKESLGKIIARADSARRLVQNEDFNNLVMVGYLTDEPQRLAELMASGRLPNTNMENCMKEMTAIGLFRNYMKMHIEQGNMARDELESLEEARQEAIEAEEAALAEAG